MILDALARNSAARVKAAKEQRPLREVEASARNMEKGTFSFEKALKTRELSFICEVKKASPSKGIIAEDFPYLQIAKDYEEAGAAAISVLTEPKYFMGSDRYLEEIVSSAAIPVLRKDFTVDEYQIYEAKILGASAVLLICALLDEKTLHHWIGLCDSLGLSALAEAHTEEEVKYAAAAGARVIGVNNRNLKTFEVDVQNFTRFRSLVPPSILFVAESGIRFPEDISMIKDFGVDAVLIGEALMRAKDKKAVLNSMMKQAGRGAVR